MTITFINNNLIVKLEGEIDHNNSAILRHRIDKEINSRPVKNLVLDMENVNMMDSSGIGMILGRYKNIKALNGSVFITRPKKEILKIINISGLHKIIPVCSDVCGAIGSRKGVAK